MCVYYIWDGDEFLGRTFDDYEAAQAHEAGFFVHQITLE